MRAMSNIWDGGSGGFSVYCADVLTLPAGTHTAESTERVCVDAVSVTCIPKVLMHVHL